MASDFVLNTTTASLRKEVNKPIIPESFWMEMNALIQNNILQLNNKYRKWNRFRIPADAGFQEGFGYILGRSFRN